jgi:hypothetical protein
LVAAIAAGELPTVPAVVAAIEKQLRLEAARPMRVTIVAATVAVLLPMAAGAAAEAMAGPRSYACFVARWKHLVHSAELPTAASTKHRNYPQLATAASTNFRHELLP